MANPVYVERGKNYMMRAKGYLKQKFPIYVGNRNSICTYFKGKFYNEDVTLKAIQINDTKFMIEHPRFNCWCVAFISYDGDGLVIRNPAYGNYHFFYVDHGIRDFPQHRLITGKYLDIAYKHMFAENKLKYPKLQLKIAEIKENKTKNNLKQYFNEYEIVHPSYSGFKLGGCDLIIIRKGVMEIDKNDNEFSYDILKNADAVIEVLGISFYYKKVRFNHNFKNFMGWVERMEKLNVIPVISFKGANYYHHVIMNKVIVKEVFHKKDGTPRTNYSIVKPIIPYVTDTSSLYKYIKVHGKNSPQKRAEGE